MNGRTRVLAALGTSADVEKAARELVEIFSGHPGFILNAGCAIPSETPPANLQAMIRAAAGPQARPGDPVPPHSDAP